MNPEEKRILMETASLVQENNQILHRWQRNLRWSQFGSLLRWLIFISSIAAGYYYLQPWLDQFNPLLQQAVKNLQNLQLQQSG